MPRVIARLCAAPTPDGSRVRPVPDDLPQAGLRASRLAVVELVAGLGQVRSVWWTERTAWASVTVGSSPRCTWTVDDPMMPALALALIWDQQELWVRALSPVATPELNGFAIVMRTCVLCGPSQSLRLGSCRFRLQVRNSAEPSTDGLDVPGSERARLIPVGSGPIRRPELTPATPGD